MIEFWATWCGACKAISPFFQTQSTLYPQLDYYKVDVDDQTEIAQEVGISAVSSPSSPLLYCRINPLTGMTSHKNPTFVVFSKGEKVETLLGANPATLHVR